MPRTPSHPAADSWPPTQIRLSPASVEDASLASLEMPLDYFFHSSTPHDHDPPAGFEKHSKSRAAPGTLDVGASNMLRRRRYEERSGAQSDADARRGPVPTLSDGSDSDEEEYVRFPPGGLEVRRCPEETRRSGARGDGKGRRRRGSSRDIPSGPVGARGRGRSPRAEEPRMSEPRGSGAKGVESWMRAWREPSPYVWSIDDEEEDEIRRRGGAGTGTRGRRSLAASVAQEEPLDEEEVEARLRRRKVRFVLPVRE